MKHTIDTMFGKILVTVNDKGIVTGAPASYLWYLGKPFEKMQQDLDPVNKRPRMEKEKLPRKKKPLKGQMELIP